MLNRIAAGWDPDRRDIDPTKIHYVLSRVWIYDFVPPRRFRCRLIGEEVAKLFSPNPKGRYVDEIFPDDYGRQVTDRFMTMVMRRQISHTIGDWLVSSGACLRAERIAFPLGTDGSNVDTVFGASVYGAGLPLSSDPYSGETIEVNFYDMPSSAPAVETVGAL
jgi:hypothetical protein